MKPPKKWLLIFIALGMLILACGLGDQAAETSQEKNEAAVEASQDTGETSETDQQAASKDGVTALNPQTVAATLQSYDSYRWQLHLEFDGLDTANQPRQGKIDTLIAASKDPAAMHMRFNLQGKPADDLGGAELVEIYAQDGLAYLQNPEDGTWFSFSTEDMMADIFDDVFISPDEIIALPKEAQCDQLDEPLNGIAVQQCVFDETNLSDESFTAESAKGTLYLAQEGDYPVKLELEMTGSIANSKKNALFASGTLKLSYELLEVNQPVEIVIPAEALEAPRVDDLMAEQPTPAELEWPVVADAEIDFSTEGLLSYTTASPIQTVVQFYQAELPNQGWAYNAAAEVVSSDNALLSFSKDGAELNLVISQEDNGKISVLLATATP